MEIVSGSIYLIIFELSGIVRKKGAILHCITVVVACCVIYKYRKSSNPKLSFRLKVYGFNEKGTSYVTGCELVIGF